MKELKNLIKKEFLPVLSPYGFVCYKNNLILNTIDDLLRGFCFDRHDNRLYVHLFIQPLYVPTTHQSLSYGWRLKGGHSLGDMFLLNDDQIEYTKSEIKKLLLSEKDILLTTKTASDFHDKFLVSDLKLLAYKTEIDIRYQETLTLTRSYMYPEKTCTLVEEFLRKWEKDDRKNVAWMQEIKKNMLLLQMDCSSAAKVQQLFAEWRSLTTINLKLEKIK